MDPDEATIKKVKLEVLKTVIEDLKGILISSVDMKKTGVPRMQNPPPPPEPGKDFVSWMHRRGLLPIETKPHKCPICVGNQTIVTGYYRPTGNVLHGNGYEEETCRTCNGTGIVWG